MPLSKFSLTAAFLTLMVLRLLIGLHFFNEGVVKHRDPDWSAEPFLSSAVGPLAPQYHRLIDDHDDHLLLCRFPARSVNFADDDTRLTESFHPENQDRPDSKPDHDRDGEPYWPDPELTYQFWRQYLIEADKLYRFGSPEIKKSLEKQCAALAEEIRLAKSDDADSKTDSPKLAQMQLDYQQLIDDVKIIDDQRDMANAILDKYEASLAGYLDMHREELVNYYRGEYRSVGFRQDGPNRHFVGDEVDSLKSQLNSIEQARQQKAAVWKSEIEGMWNGYENEIRDLATAAQKGFGTAKLVRPFDPERSNLKLINRWLPWFDMVIGGLLILGLFTRIASLVGAGFLASVIASQPPWIADAQPVFYQAIEMVALLVLFATAAGQYGGLDYFLKVLFAHPQGLSTEMPEPSD